MIIIIMCLTSALCPIVTFFVSVFLPNSEKDIFSTVEQQQIRTTNLLLSKFQAIILLIGTNRLLWP